MLALLLLLGGCAGTNTPRVPILPRMEVQIVNRNMSVAQVFVVAITNLNNMGERIATAVSQERTKVFIRPFAGFVFRVQLLGKSGLLGRTWQSMYYYPGTPCWEINVGRHLLSSTYMMSCS